MANKAFTPAELASNIAFQTAKKASPKVSTTPAPLQSLLKPQVQQPQATFSNNIPGVGLLQVNNPIKTAVETPKVPAVLPTTGSGKKSLSEFGETIKTKYPQYADMDPTELGRKMIEKYPQYKDMVDEEPIKASMNIGDTATNLAVGAAGLIGSSIATEVAGKAIKQAGKKLYTTTLNPTQQEAEALQSYNAGSSNFKPKIATDTALEAPLFQKPGNSISSSFGMMGTKSGIGQQAENFSRQLWQGKVQPMLNDSKSTVDVKGLIGELKTKVPDFAKQDPDKLQEYNDSIKELEKSFKDVKYSNMSLKDLQDLKSGLQNRVQNKFFKGKEISNAYQELKGKLSTLITKALHTKLKEEYGVDSANLYKDYANMKGLSEVGPKALTEAGRKGGAGALTDWLVGTLATPVTTTVGKIGYKAGNLLDKLSGKPLENTFNFLKKLAKKPAVEKVGLNVAKLGKLVSVIEDGGLIPGSPSNIAQNAMNTSESEKIYISGTKMRVPKSSLKPVKGLKKEAVQTDLGFIDKDGNVWN